MLKILTFLTQTIQLNKKNLKKTHQPHKNNSDIYYTSRYHAYIHTSERRFVSSMGWYDINQAWDEGEAW